MRCPAVGAACSAFAHILCEIPVKIALTISLGEGQASQDGHSHEGCLQRGRSSSRGPKCNSRRKLPAIATRVTHSFAMCQKLAMEQRLVAMDDRAALPSLSHIVP
jgi:hypothetical protein